MTRSILREPRESRNPQKFCFPSQNKYSPPIIIFVHGANPYLDFFQISKKSDLPPIRSAEQIRGIGGYV